MFENTVYISEMLENKIKYSFLILFTFTTGKKNIPYKIFHLLIGKLCGKENILYGKYYKKFIIQNDSINFKVEGDSVSISYNDTLLKEKIRESFKYELYLLEEYYNTLIDISEEQLNKIYFNYL